MFSAFDSIIIDVPDLAEATAEYSQLLGISPHGGRVALGNVGTAEDLPALENAASDPDPLISEHAEWALTQIRAKSGPKSA